MNSEANKQVVWREGTLLRPQHFQHQQRQLQKEASMRVQLTRPYAWGLSDLQLDPDALHEGRFVVRSLRALFADGTLLSLESEQCASLGLRLDDHCSPETESLLIYLCLSPRAEPLDGREACASKPALLGFESHTIELADTSQPSRRAAVELAWPALSCV